MKKGEKGRKNESFLPKKKKNILNTREREREKERINTRVLTPSKNLYIYGLGSGHTSRSKAYFCAENAVNMLKL